MQEFPIVHMAQEKLCKCCDGLSIAVLIKLAEEEFSNDFFSRKSYYPHHPSYSDLLQSASDGCGLCQLICSGFQELQIQEFPWENDTREEAIRSVEEEGGKSDIKIAIAAEHLYSRRTLEDVQLFDAILVQAGPPEFLGADTDDPEHNWGIPPLRLVIGVPRGQQKQIRGYRVGRDKIVPNLGADENNALAKSWLMDCCGSHETCPSKMSSILPTRVLDVGTVDDPRRLRLFLTASIEGSYVALSHCWGGPISPLLSTETIEPFQEGLQFDSLPANFRDAISVTRGLGIQYLWIDSLCIIQNSPTDWEIESKKMGAIYRDAAVTISASTSRRSTDGFLDGSQSGLANDAEVSIKSCKEDSPSDFVKVTLKREYEEDLRALFLESPLNTRGWTLQETVLSPRIIHYGTQKIYWQCPRGFQSADGIPPGTKMPEDNGYSELAYALYPKTLEEHKNRQPDPGLILKEYYTLVAEYSARTLSFHSDKLPAMAGLATLIHPFLKGDYMAGVWSIDFGQGLLWRHEMGKCEHVRENRAPSWSWAVTNEPLYFQIADSKPETSKYKAQLVDHSVIPRSKENPYGQVDSGQLTIKGLTKEFARSRQVIRNRNPEFSVASVYLDESEEGGGIDSMSSVFAVKSEHEDYLLCMADGEGHESADGLIIDHSLFSEREYLVLLINVSHNHDADGAEYCRGYCLVLIKAMDNENVYNRAGFLISGSRWPANFAAWLDTWDAQTITIA